MQLEREALIEDLLARHVKFPAEVASALENLGLDLADLCSFESGPALYKFFKSEGVCQSRKCYKSL